MVPLCFAAQLLLQTFFWQSIAKGLLVAFCVFSLCMQIYFNWWCRCRRHHWIHLHRGCHHHLLQVLLVRRLWTHCLSSTVRMMSFCICAFTLDGHKGRATSLFADVSGTSLPACVLIVTVSVVYDYCHGRYLLCCDCALVSFSLCLSVCLPIWLCVCLVCLRSFQLIFGLLVFQLNGTFHFHGLLLHLFPDLH